MPDLNRGKIRFEDLVEYPLPKQTGVRDYLFYFVGPKDDYGKNARVFFDRFYQNHTRKDVRSFEDLIDDLHTEVTTGGVQQIREIVIVAHANSQALLHPIVNSDTEMTRQNFKYVADISLARLQKAFLEGEFQDFRDKRKRVVAHLRADSWVTIRACNFGISKQGMYATYSFFGGRANVYAPNMYQVFWSCPLVPGSRLETNKQAHQHMVKQHFFPKDIHSPERKDIIVSALVDPARFAEPFEVASKRIDNPLPDEAAHYQGIVDDLNARRRNSSLNSTFLAHELPLSDSAKVTVVKKNVAWLIDDKLKHEGDLYKIQYQIYEAVADSGPGNKPTATLWAQARLPETILNDKTFPIQLFLDDKAHDNFLGILFDLAAYTDLDADLSNKTRLNAVLALLRTGQLSDGTGGGVSIAAVFKDKLNVEISAKPRPGSSAGADQWLIDDQAHYLIKLEHPSTAEGVQAHTITVYSNLDRKARIANQIFVLSKDGINPDTPGTELPAYLDRFTIDELASVIDYLRSPFKPGNSLYIYHAQGALIRKREFIKWWQEHKPDELTAPLSKDSYSDLGLNESDDRRATSYESNFNRIWNEVKASAPSSTVIQEDLFAEEELARKLNISEEEFAASLPDLEPDSFAVNAEDLSDFEKPFTTHVPSSKRIFDETKEDPTANCKEFADAIAKWKEVQNLEPDEIKKLLEEQKTSEGRSFSDVLLEVAKHYKFMRDMAKYLDVVPLPWVPTSISSAARELAKRILTRELDAELSWWAAREAPVLSRLAWFKAGLGALWAVSVISIPLIFLEHFGEEWQNSEEVWENVGKLTAIRQWLRRVEDVTYNAPDVPDLHEIDISTPVSTMPSYKNYPFANEPYYIGRYFLEHLEETGRYVASNIFAPDRMKIGFDRGVIAMKFNVASELERRAQRGVSEVLQQWHLDSCKIHVLRAAGILDAGALEAHVIGRLAEALRNRFPKL